MWEAIWHLLERLAGMGDVKATRVLMAARAAAEESDRAAEAAKRLAAASREAADEAAFDATTALNAAELARVSAQKP